MKTNLELVQMLRGCAHNLYRASLCAGPPMITELAHELLHPKVGDLVMETSTYYHPGHDPLEGIGTLLEIIAEPSYTPEQWAASGGVEGEPIPTHAVYVIRLDFDDDRLFRWSNASFVKVKTERIG